MNFFLLKLEVGKEVFSLLQQKLILDYRLFYK